MTKNSFDSRRIMSAPRALMAVAAVPVVGVLLTALLFAGASRDNEWLQHTLVMKQNLAMLESVVQDIQLGKRGYVITNDERYLQPYREATVEAGRLHRELIENVTENPQQEARIRSFKVYIDKVIATAERAVNLVQSGRQDEAVRFLSSEHGEAAMAKFRDGIRDAWADEDVLFVKRQDDYVSNWRWLVSSLGLTLLASIGVAYILFLKEAERLRASEQRVERLAMDTKILEEKVAERTADIERERDRAEALLRDVTHRIGNMLALVVGFLNMHSRHAKNAEVSKVLNGARDRVLAISSAQRRMNVANDLEMVRVDQLIAGVVDDISENQVVERVEFDIDIAPLHASAKDVTMISVLVQEFCINALKHAFPDGRSGKITVRLESQEEGGARLTVADNGVGLGASHSNGEGLNGQGGLGAQITEKLASQFGGDITYQHDQGTTVTVTMPNVQITPPNPPHIEDRAA